MIRVGLTGGIASGKSSVARLLAARGVPVLDADQVARQVVAPGTPGLAAIVAHFGPDLLQPDGSLDRKALGAIVVQDPVQRRALEAITHPAIYQHMLSWLGRQASEGHPAAVVEAALMVETGSYTMYDRVLVVACPPDVQRARLAQRQGIRPDAAQKWIDSQMPLAQKIAVADAVIHNDGTPDDLPKAVDKAWAKILSAGAHQ